MRDLQVLAGTQRLLAVLEDVPTLRYLLSLTAIHAESAAHGARLVLLTLEERPEERNGGGG
ncbi:hypothetical protein [Streptomyces sp. SID13588]|uniref:hypothetical protein n=1 Tax=Streptomyces sp. SID13588 TaxID=2706051 RepID=UPI0013C80AE5|nr:hypothetical protein [Streptomyces sp. SID13588]NEA77217.1 hypothetical protein [Streptomyces sp. SID13588]